MTCMMCRRLSVTKSERREEIEKVEQKNCTKTKVKQKLLVILDFFRFSSSSSMSRSFLCNLKMTQTMSVVIIISPSSSTSDFLLISPPVAPSHSPRPSASVFFLQLNFQLSFEFYAAILSGLCESAELIPHFHAILSPVTRVTFIFCSSARLNGSGQPVSLSDSQKRAVFFGLRNSTLSLKLFALRSDQQHPKAHADVINLPDIEYNEHRRRCRLLDDKEEKVHEKKVSNGY